jgi:acetoin:2,6-dichlorophenolindophenol oxidoreductase subunit beta
VTDIQRMSFAQAINQAMHQAMEQAPEVICYGLGVDDPKRIFGTTAGLVEEFGTARVFDMPTAENAMLGVGIGAAINGLKPVMVHQRLDFFLLAMDQLVNTAAKWYYMFGGQRSVPITIRLVLGRGWGQGPTHSQNLHAWFAHVPGLKVVMPTNPADAKGMLLESIFDPNPVVFLEHRWLHHQQGDVPVSAEHRVPIDRARVIRKGTDITIVAVSYQVVEAIRASQSLQKQGINAEVIDLRSIQPIDWRTIIPSVMNTGRLLVADTGAQTAGLAAEVVARCTSDCFDKLKCAPERLAMPDYPEPTSYGLTRQFYNSAFDIAHAVERMIYQREPVSDFSDLRVKGHHDVPGDWFKGPF